MTRKNDLLDELESLTILDPEEEIREALAASEHPPSAVRTLEDMTEDEIRKLEELYQCKIQRKR